MRTRFLPRVRHGWLAYVRDDATGAERLVSTCQPDVLSTFEIARGAAARMNMAEARERERQLAKRHDLDSMPDGHNSRNRLPE